MAIVVFISDSLREWRFVAARRRFAANSLHPARLSFANVSYHAETPRRYALAGAGARVILPANTLATVNSASPLVRRAAIRTRLCDIHATTQTTDTISLL